MTRERKPRGPGARGSNKAMEVRTERSEQVLDRYLGELAKMPLLSAEQEIALAREIEQLVSEHWRTLLSYRPALCHLATAVTPHLEQTAVRFAELCELANSDCATRSGRGTRDPRYVEARDRAAEELRVLDMRGEALRAADAAVFRVFSCDGRARAFLERVRGARGVQRDAKQRFVHANLRLVIAMARRHAQTMLPLSDMIQEGNLGLMQAVERFDYRRGYRFSTYASWWIRHYLNRALSGKGRMVRIPVHTLEDMAKVSRAQHKYAVRTGRSLTSSELSDELGMPEKKLELLKASRRSMFPTSMDDNLAEGREQTLHDVLASSTAPDPEQDLSRANWSRELERLLDDLPEREANVLRLRFGLIDNQELTLHEIGARYGLSRERIRQIQEDAFAKLRAAIRRGQAPGDQDDHAAA